MKAEGRRSSRQQGPRGANSTMMKPGYIRTLKLLTLGLIFFLPSLAGAQYYQDQQESIRLFVDSSSIYVFDNSRNLEVEYELISADKPEEFRKRPSLYSCTEAYYDYPKRIRLNAFLDSLNCVLAGHRVDSIELQYEVEITEHEWVYELACSQAEKPAEMYNYSFISRILRKDSMIWEKEGYSWHQPVSYTASEFEKDQLSFLRTATVWSVGNTGKKAKRLFVIYNRRLFEGGKK